MCVGEKALVSFNKGARGFFFNFYFHGIATFHIFIYLQAVENWIRRAVTTVALSNAIKRHNTLLITQGSR